MRWYIYDENEHNNTVFRLRFVNSICTSSEEKITGEKWTLMTSVHITVEDEVKVTDHTPCKLFPSHLEPAVSQGSSIRLANKSPYWPISW
jgi:hypothetical protein